jgi:hypothetical protein
MNHTTYISNVSFQYGLSVLLITEVVFVCSPLIVATANGSGKPVGSTSAGSQGKVGAVGRTEHLALVESISGDNYDLVSIR